MALRIASIPYPAIVSPRTVIRPSNPIPPTMPKGSPKAVIAAATAAELPPDATVRTFRPL